MALRRIDVHKDVPGPYLDAAQQGLAADTSQLDVPRSGSLLAFKLRGFGEVGQRWLAQLKPVRWAAWRFDSRPSQSKATLEAVPVSGYLVANYKLTDPEAYRAYVPAVLPTLEAHGAEVLVADYESEAVEGAPHSVTIVLRFPSKEAARAWYRSPEYQAIINLRTDNTDGFVVFTDHFTTPFNE